MRILLIDVDTLRPDHLGCYGYHRPTSPTIDRLAAEGMRFDKVHTSDSPCLPSRTALSTGQFGIRNGVVDHGGLRADPWPAGRSRGRRSALATESLGALLRDAGYWCATVSTFASRHSAFHWYSGFNEVFDLGTDGLETADRVERAASDWLRRRGSDDDWFLHVHFWDPHTPYRTPADEPDRLAGTRPRHWVDDDELVRQRDMAGPHSAQEVMGFAPSPDAALRWPRQPQSLESLADVEAVIDGYDTGIRYADDHVGRLVATLDELGVLDETAIVVTSDHGESFGELGIWCDHQTADSSTHRVPWIVRWPGLAPRVDGGLHYSLDLAATLVELAGAEVAPGWDGQSFAEQLRSGHPLPARPHLVLSCGAWAVQRAVRFDRWLWVRTLHDAFHDFPGEMLFDLATDPHERDDVANRHPEVAGQARALLDEWQREALGRAPTGIDPLAVVVEQGGGHYVRGRLASYVQRLEATGRGRAARSISERAGGVRTPGLVSTLGT